FNHWDVGATAGIKAVIGKHYTISFDYNIGLNKAQSTYGLRNSTFQLSVGYRF
ncbi:outer membrane beta-barrel protein, partial [Bacteroides uniformis]